MVPDVTSRPENEGILRRLRERGHRGRPAVERPEDVERPYETLGTHPDLVAHLWDVLGGALPTDCRFVLFDNPVLIHPETGIVFGFAGGTHTYAFRLPEPDRQAALAAGATRVHTYPHPLHPPFDLEAVGPEWVFGRWVKGEEAWCRAAYEWAGG